MKNKKLWIAVIALVLVAGLMTTLYFVTREKPKDGEKTITVTVVHKDGTEKVFTCKTTETYLAPVLLQNNIVEDIQDGMIYVADGELADFSVDEGWWAIYKGAEKTAKGAEKTVIADGDSFKLVYTIGF